MRKAIFLLVLSIGVLIYVIVAPFSPPIFFTILGMAIVSIIWGIDYLIRVRWETQN